MNLNAAQGEASAQDGSSAATDEGNAQPPTAPNVNLPVIPGQIFGPTPAGQTPAVKAAPATNIQEQILALNATLPALGLSKVEVQEIDNLATQIQNFNPATYTNLVNQFEALARQSIRQGAPNPATNASAVGSQNTATKTKGNGSDSQG